MTGRIRRPWLVAWSPLPPLRVGAPRSMSTFKEPTRTGRTFEIPPCRVRKRKPSGVQIEPVIDRMGRSAAMRPSGATQGDRLTRSNSVHSSLTRPSSGDGAAPSLPCLPTHRTGRTEGSAQQLGVGGFNDFVDQYEPLVERYERTFHRIHREPLQFTPAIPESLHQQGQLARHGGTAHQPVVGVHGDPEAT